VEGRARQAVSVADASGGGIFGELLAQLFQTMQAGPLQETAAAQQSALTVQQSVQSASQVESTQQASAANAATSAPGASQATQTTTPTGKHIHDRLEAMLPRQMPPWLAALTAYRSQPATGTASPLSTQASGINGAAGGAGSQSAASVPGATATATPQSIALSSSIPGATGPAFPASASTPVASAPSSLATASATNSNPIAQNATASTIAAAFMQTFAALQGANASSNPAQRAASSTAGAPAASSSQSPTASSSSSLLSTLSKASATPAPASAPAAASPASQISDAERQVFAQATHNALHQGATTSVTEAKTLSLNLDSSSGGTASSSQQTSGTGRPAAGADPQSAQPQAGATGDPVTNATIQPVLTHDANTLQQPAAQADANNISAANAPNSAIASAAQASAPANNFALQVGPASTTPDSSLQPNVQAIAVSIAAQAQPGAKQFNIRLDPPELGRVDVRLMVDSAGKAQAHLAVDKPQTLELLQRDSGTLARALKESGVQLNNNGLQFSLKGQDRQSGGSQPKGRALAVAAVPTTALATGPASTSNIFASGTGVDIRV
jgi:flagellar hook-length control protein FliK